MRIFAQVDVTFPDDPKVVEAGGLAELCYVRCVLRGRAHLTDGVIDRRVLPRWLAGVPGKHEQHMTRLVSVGLLEEHVDGWRIPEKAWGRWNPTRAQVEAKREAEAQRKQAYRDKLSQRDSASRDDGTNPESATPKPEPEEKPEPEPKKVSSLVTPVPAAPTEDDDEMKQEAHRRTMAVARAGRLQGTFAAYEAVVLKSLKAEGWKPSEPLPPSPQSALPDVDAVRAAHAVSDEDLCPPPRRQGLKIEQEAS